VENNWTVDQTKAWLLEKLRNDPAAQPSSTGTIIQKSGLGEEDPPWNLIRQAMEQLTAQDRIFAEPKYTMPSRGIPDSFHFVKLKESG